MAIGGKSARCGDSDCLQLFEWVWGDKGEKKREPGTGRDRERGGEELFGSICPDQHLSLSPGSGTLRHSAHLPRSHEEHSKGKGQTPEPDGTSSITERLVAGADVKDIVQSAKAQILQAHGAQGRCGHPGQFTSQLQEAGR